MSMQLENLTWPLLLAHWLNVARSSASFPKSEEGERWRNSVAPAINLQAVTFALADLARLAGDDRPFARDKAGVLIREQNQRLEETWRGEDMPPMLVELQDDASRALEISRFAVAVELVWRGPGSFVIPPLPELEPRGTLAVMQPGTIVMPGEPVAWWVDRSCDELEAVLSSCERRSIDLPQTPRQIYRQLNDAGRIERDVMTSVLDDPPPGLPLLVPIFDDGARIGRFTFSADEWEAQQRRAMQSEAVPAVMLSGIER